MAAGGNPMILSANVTRGLGRKTSFSATVKNVFRETASLSGIQPTRPKTNMHLLSQETLVLYSTFKCPHISGPRAQAGWQQQAVLCGGGAPVTWCGRHQDAGADGAEGLTVELCAQAQVWPGR